MANDRKLTYEVAVDATSAQKAARSVKDAMQKEMSQVSANIPDWMGAPNLGNLPARFDQASAAAQRLQGQYRALATEQASFSGGLSKLAGMGGLLLGGLGALGISLSAKEIVQQGIELAEYGTQVRRLSEGFVVLAGSEANATAKMLAMSRATDGGMDKMQAMQRANYLAALGLADTAEAMERVTKNATIAGRVMGQNLDFTLENLALAASNQSKRRLDQIGISLETFNPIYDRLRETMSDQDAFLEAALQTWETTFAAMKDGPLAAASGVEKLTARIKDLKMEFAEGALSQSIDAFAGNIAIGILGGGSTEDRIERLLAQAQHLRDAMDDLRSQHTDYVYFGAELPEEAFAAQNADAMERVQVLEQVAEMLRDVDQATIDGSPNAAKYKDELLRIGEAAVTGALSDEQISRLGEINTWWQILKQSASEYAQMVALANGATLPTPKIYDWQINPLQAWQGTLQNFEIKDVGTVLNEIDQERERREKEAQRLAKQTADKAQRDWESAVDKMQAAFENAMDQGVNYAKGLIPTDVNPAAPGQGGPFENVYRAIDVWQNLGKPDHPEWVDKEGKRHDAKETERWAEMLYPGMSPEEQRKAAEADVRPFLMGNWGPAIEQGLIDENALINLFKEQQLAEQWQSTYAQGILGKHGIDPKTLGIYAGTAFGAGAISPDLISGASGGAATGAAPSIAPDAGAYDFKGGAIASLNAMQEDKGYLDACYNVGVIGARQMAKGWIDEIGQTPWAHALESAIVDDILLVFAGQTGGAGR
jgi:hypothetical protein